MSGLRVALREKVLRQDGAGDPSAKLGELHCDSTAEKGDSAALTGHRDRSLKLELLCKRAPHFQIPVPWS